MKYSIIVPTYNRSLFLKKNLECLAEQTIPKCDYEIIVVNDGSKDNTDKIAENFGSIHTDINFIYLKQKNGGPAKARNIGIKKAKGEIIFFTDDDCVVPVNWVETLADGYLQHPEIAGTGGWYKLSNPQGNLFAKYYEFKMENKKYGLATMAQEIKNSDFLKNPAGNTSNMSYRKKILDEVGGFDESITYPGFDDTDLKKRIMNKKYQLLYIPLWVINAHPLRFFDICKRLFNFGRGRYYFSKKHDELFFLYNPTIKKMRNLINQQPSGNNLFRIIAIFDFLLTKLGWEYQRIIGSNE